MHPYSRASMAVAFTNRALLLNGALGLSKSSVENFLECPQAIVVGWLIFRVRSASSVMRPPRLDTPAQSTNNFLIEVNAQSPAIFDCVARSGLHAKLLYGFPPFAQRWVHQVHAFVFLRTLH